MSYQALTIWLLVSAPSDVPAEHLEIVRSTISRWNVNHGRPIAATVIPLAWTEHAVAAFGDRPQGLINEQLTDQADMGVAIFRNRLGTDTGVAVSGTIEEVERLAAAGKPVGVLRDRTPGPAASGTAGAKELLRLEKHLSDGLFPRALVFAFENPAQLIGHVDSFITRAVAQLQQRLEDDQTGLTLSDRVEMTDRLEVDLQRGADPNRGVWPRIESTERPVTDSKGRIKTRRDWSLVLSNQTGGPARNVRYEFLLEEGKIFNIGNSGPPESIAMMPPGIEQRFPLHFVMGSANRAECRVTWEDEAGEHVTEATVTT